MRINSQFMIVLHSHSAVTNPSSSNRIAQ